MSGRASSEQPAEPLTVRAVLPGLAFVLLVDAATVAGWMPRLGVFALAWPWVLAVLPWMTLLVLQASPAALGYRRRRALAEYGWGMLAGGAWRVLSIALNLALTGGGDRLGWAAGLWASLVWVPLTEETFFRGYLGGALVRRWGLWPGTLAQALLFTLTPVHWAQGGLHLISIFGFGVLAGWLSQVRRLGADEVPAPGMFESPGRGGAGSTGRASRPADDAR